MQQSGEWKCWGAGEGLPGHWDRRNELQARNDNDYELWNRRNSRRITNMEYLGGNR